MKTYTSFRHNLSQWIKLEGARFYQERPKDRQGGRKAGKMGKGRERRGEEGKGGEGTEGIQELSNNGMVYLAQQ